MTSTALDYYTIEELLTDALLELRDAGSSIFKSENIDLLNNDLRCRGR